VRFCIYNSSYFGLWILALRLHSQCVRGGRSELSLGTMHGGESGSETIQLPNLARNILQMKYNTQYGVSECSSWVSGQWTNSEVNQWIAQCMKLVHKYSLHWFYKWVSYFLVTRSSQGETWPRLIALNLEMHTGKILGMLPSSVAPCNFIDSCNWDVFKARLEGSFVFAAQRLK